MKSRPFSNYRGKYGCSEALVKGSVFVLLALEFHLHGSSIDYIIANVDRRSESIKNKQHQAFATASWTFASSSLDYCSSSSCDFFSLIVTRALSVPLPIKYRTFSC